MEKQTAQTATVTEVLELIERSPADENLRDATSLPVGSVFRQGDVYLMRLDPSYVEGEALHAGDGGTQLVPGHSKGSRHIFQAGSGTMHRHTSIPEGVRLFSTDLACGVFVVGDGFADLTHPEHAHGQCAPGSKWFVWRQLDSQTRRAVQD